MASAPPPTTYFVRGLFLRLLAAVYLVAFASFWVQAEGLVGTRGLLPVDAFLERAADGLGADAFLRLPTVLWLAPTNALLHGVCAAGVAISLLALAGFWPLASFALLWALYLSIVVAGQDFMSFQWDVLLLEAGLVALLAAPARRRAALAERSPAPGVGIWLLRLLVWKLMFLSGATKLLAYDETWWELTALEYHYWTQPLPWWTSWWADRLPSWLDAACVAIALLVELIVPWLVFCGARARVAAFALFVTLQLAIAWTGSYGFFNLLTIVLCLSLLEDRHFERVLPLLPGRRLAPPRARDLQATMRRRSWAGLRGAVAVVLVAASLLVTVRELARTAAPRATGRVADGVAWSERVLLAPGRPLLEALAPLRSVNGYGLFRSMTTTRREIVLERSDDGVSWEEVEFRWKPGEVRRRPALAAPHQPRLDWQMWFAALSPREAGWLGTLARRLLEGQDDVLELLAGGEAERPPPRYVRLRFYSYRFADPETRRETGAWWRREAIGDLTDRLTIEDLDRLERASGEGR